MSADESTEGETTRITRKGQVTIPKELREEMATSMEEDIREKRGTGSRPRQ